MTGAERKPEAERKAKETAKWRRGRIEERNAGGLREDCRGVEEGRT